MKYLICGFSGAGKTWSLKEIKKNPAYAGFKFFDLDDEIASLCGYSNNHLGSLISEKGWEWFRNIETVTLKTLINKNDHFWLSLGGGTLTSENVAFLSNQSNLQIYWLNTPFELCWSRIKDDSNRPLVALGENEIREIYQNRLKTYQNYPKLEL